MNPLARLLEAALFASARPIPLDELASLDPDASPAALQSALDELRETYDTAGHGVELVEVGGGWQILTRAEYTEAIERAQLTDRRRGRSGPAARERDTDIERADLVEPRALGRLGRRGAVPEGGADLPEPRLDAALT